jgi:three-Cys-motif partner protein
MTAVDEFFDEMSEQSRIKVEIVEKYFSAWSKVLLPTVQRRGGKLGYIDLFSGPGIYEDGTKSTPILIIEQAINNTELSERLVTIINDANPEFIKMLNLAIKNVPGIDKLKNKPIVSNDIVDDQLVDIFQKINFIPSLFFIDPWGYKGISLSLLNSILINWGCDCILFFNYNRINMGLNNPKFNEHIDRLFGKKGAGILRSKVDKLNPLERELTIIEGLCNAIINQGFEYVLPFGFKDESSKKTSHYLIFISKHEKGYDIMKRIMAKCSSELNQGVPSFQYCIASKKQPFLFSFNRPLDGLSQMLLDEFEGQTLKMVDIFRQHNKGKPFIDKNYKDVLYQMEQKGLLKAKPSWNKRKPNTFGNDVIVIFPEK